VSSVVESTVSEQFQDRGRSTNSVVRHYSTATCILVTTYEGAKAGNDP